MRFPNAASGVKKLFTAEILSLISTLAMIIAVCLAVVAAAGSNAQNVTSGTIAAGMGTIILMAAAAVLAIIAGILALIGLINASKDEIAFKTALIATIISLVAAVIMGIFSRYSVVQSICQCIQNIMSVVVTVFVIQGIINLAGRLKEREVAAKGKTLMTILIVIFALAFVASLISAIFGGALASTIAGIIALVALVLDLIGYIIYLTLLAKAKKMLAK